MSEKPADDALSVLLRAGDPAADDPGLSPVERTAMRRRMLAAGRERRRRPNRWLVPATAAMALLALALGLALLRPGAPSPAPVAEATRPAAAASPGQQIQFTTDNGTLVVWVLQPMPTS